MGLLFGDKIIVKNVHSTNRTTVTENRAPTDESVKLLKEFEEKAESKFCARIEVKTNLLEYTILQYYECIDTAGYKFKYICNINGKEYIGDVTSDRGSPNAEMEMFQKIHDDLGKRISTEIVVEAIDRREL